MKGGVMLVNYQQLARFPYIEPKKPDKFLLQFFKASAESGDYATDIGYITVAMLKYILEDAGGGKDRRHKYPVEYDLACKIYEIIFGGDN